MSVLSYGNGFVLMGTFWAMMLGITAMQSKRNTKESFLVADRNIGWLVGSFSIAASWIWAPALFISSQKAFEAGLAGAFWFTVPNILTLIIFGFLAVRIRSLLPNGYSLPQFIARRFDARTHIVYIVLFMGLQVCCGAVQLLAGAAVLNILTGIPTTHATIGIAIIFLSYSLMRGMKASIKTDYLQMCLILFTCLVIVPLVLFWYDGWSMLKIGLGGKSGNFGSIFNASEAYSFGILVTISLLAGPIGDQQHWQRAFSIRKKDLRKSYFVSGFIFGVVPVLLSLLGFVAAGMVRSNLLVVDQAQMCSVALVANVLPTYMVMLFVFMLLSGLASTGDSVLCAASSLFAVDIYQRYMNDDPSSAEIVRVSRFTMIIVTLLSILIALIPGMKIMYLFLFYGTLRACDMVPTVLSLYKRYLGKNSIFYGVISAAVVGLPLYSYGKLAGKIDIQVMSIILVIMLSAIVPLIVTKFSSTLVDFEGNEISQ